MEQGWVDAITTAVHDAVNKPSVISISWGWAELEQALGLLWSPAAIDAVSDAISEAAVMGVTVLAASGDDGSRCQISDGKAHVLYPASDPGVTACGGTTIADISGSVFSELTWNDNGITGGGISDVFNPPPWQSSANIPLSVNPPGDRHGRGVPDVAGYANGYQIVFAGESQGPYWGTSETAPLYAGLVALLNAARGESMGYLNPTLYGEAGTSVFRDIADGGSNASSGTSGYKSGPGWDACTGLGSIDGTALLSARPHPSIQATITRTDPNGDMSAIRLPVTFDFEVSGIWFTPGGRIGGLPQSVTADAGGSFTWDAGGPGANRKAGDVFSVTDLASGATASAVIAEIEG